MSYFETKLSHTRFKKKCKNLKERSGPYRLLATLTDQGYLRMGWEYILTNKRWQITQIQVDAKALFGAPNQLLALTCVEC